MTPPSKADGVAYHTVRMLRMSREEFEAVVGEALDDLPAEIAQYLDNVVVVVEEEPSEEDCREVDLDPDESELFGLYQGMALPERGVTFGPDLPDRIVIFRRPLLRSCGDRVELIREIRDTVVHEFGHYFGLGEDDLP
jgi:predicted Zn-dependent protease with MMP-like domain